MSKAQKKQYNAFARLGLYGNCPSLTRRLTVMGNNIVKMRISFHVHFWEIQIKIMIRT
ncbi:predicted protein [Botrytis cinerea T4]|uniref:Uncharacterized protein n=1 Tax=Botryotinia fuckeliana (strain T4) TaxID=999810 RepID=G2YXV6_BOTF4|nr:predicted protein [Botrytis cinerea T4]